LLRGSNSKDKHRHKCTALSQIYESGAPDSILFKLNPSPGRIFGINQTLPEIPRKTIMFELNNIELYNKALGINQSLEKVAKDLPRNTYFLANLLKKAAGAIPAEIAEANTQERSDERKNYFWAAWNAIQDCSGWIEIAARQGYIPEEKRNYFRVSLNDLSHMLQDLIRESKPTDVSLN